MGLTCTFGKKKSCKSNMSQILINKNSGKNIYFSVLSMHLAPLGEDVSSAYETWLVICNKCKLVGGKTLHKMHVRIIDIK